MSVQILTDDDVGRWLTPTRTREWMRAALKAHTFGELSAPARADAQLGQRRLRLTAGQAHAPEGVGSAFARTWRPATAGSRT